MLEKTPYTLAIFVCLLFSFSYQNLFSQNLSNVNSCGTHETIDHEFDKSAFRLFLKNYMNNPSRSITSIPVRIHIARDDDGKGGMTNEEAIQTIENANQYFAEANIEFFICGPIRNFNNSRYFNFINKDERALTDRFNIENVINIYFVNTIIYETTLLCGYSVFPWMEEDFVLMTKDCSIEGNTLAHELGHYFGLFHTHTIINGYEYVDKSNCATTGDLLCDTEADPVLGWFNVNQNCKYIGYDTDPLGDLYTPDPMNIMSYSLAQCRSFFTKEQFARMHYYLKENRTNLECINVYPDLINQQLISKNSKFRSGDQIKFNLNIQNIGDTTANNSEIEFFISETDTISFGTQFIGKKNIGAIKKNKTMDLEIDLNIPFSLSTGSYYLMACLDSNNEVDEISEENNCKSFPIKIDNSAIHNLSIYPNPVKNNALLFLRGELKGEYKIEIFSPKMERVKLIRSYKTGTEFFQNLALEDLPQAVYFIKISTIGFTHTFKFVKL